MIMRRFSTPKYIGANLVTWGAVCCATWEACSLLLTSFATLDSLATCVVPPVVWGEGGSARRGMEGGGDGGGGGRGQDQPKCDGKT